MSPFFLLGAGILQSSSSLAASARMCFTASPPFFFFSRGGDPGGSLNYFTVEEMFSFVFLANGQEILVILLCHVHRLDHRHLCIKSHRMRRVQVLIRDRKRAVNMRCLRSRRRERFSSVAALLYVKDDHRRE